MELKVLFVEDDDQIRVNLKKIFDNEIIEGYALSVDTLGVFSEGISQIKKVEYDIVVLDLYNDKGEKDEEAGKRILDDIRRNVFVPVIFYTGHAHKIKDLSSEIVGVVSKGDGLEALNLEIKRIVTSKLALLKKNINNHISELLRAYFWDTIDGEKQVFKPAQNDYSLGYLLLRRIAGSLSKSNIKELLGDDKINSHKAHPMEFYIYPSLGGEFELGEIIFRDNIYYAILTPSCDFVEDKLTKRDRRAKKVLLSIAQPLSETEYYADYKTNNNSKNKDRLLKLIETRKGDQFFFLPGTPFMENMILDFQNKTMVDYEELSSYDRIAKLDSPFAQSMVSSFIRYYNRIGFPDIDGDYVISKIAFDS